MSLKKLALIAAATTVLSGVGIGVASAAPTTFGHYVALGDSYTAGPLIPFQRLDPLTCFRSTNNYPAWLADDLGIDDYTDASCSGADTTNMTAPQSIPLGQAGPQFDALKPDTDLVSLGIGGNDFSVFGTLVGDCPKLAADDPTGSPCQDSFTVDGVDTMKQRLVETQARVTAVLKGVHERSPNATVLLIGYPRIAPETGYCPDILPFADGDVAWLNSVETALNDALANAANADGDTTYVDTFAPSLGHDACATGGAAWIQGTDLDIFAAAPFHPRKSGMVAMASVIANTLAGSAVTDRTVTSRALADSAVPNSAVPNGAVPNSTRHERVADPRVAGELAATTGALGG